MTDLSTIENLEVEIIFNNHLLENEREIFSFQCALEDLLSSELMIQDNKKGIETLLPWKDQYYELSRAIISIYGENKYHCVFRIIDFYELNPNKKGFVYQFNNQFLKNLDTLIKNNKILEEFAKKHNW